MVSQHHVIKNPDPQQLPAFPQPFRQTPVVGGRLGIPRWVVVHKQHGRRRIPNSGLECFPRMDQGHRQGSFRDPDRVLETMPLVKKQHPEGFFFFIPETGAQNVVHIPCTTNFGTEWARFSRYAPSELNSGHNL